MNGRIDAREQGEWRGRREENGGIDENRKTEREDTNGRIELIRGIDHRMGRRDSRDRPYTRVTEKRGSVKRGRRAAHT